VHVLIDRDGPRYRWRLVRRTGSGADLLARSVPEYPDERACYQAAGQLAEAAPDSMLVVQQPDGHWRWVVRDPDGQPLAESPAVFRDATSCGHALAETCREAAALPVG
jgi:hypothetical protein